MKLNLEKEMDKYEKEIMGKGQEELRNYLQEVPVSMDSQIYRADG